VYDAPLAWRRWAPPSAAARSAGDLREIGPNKRLIVWGNQVG
jgi:hypothetical protein